MEPIGYESLWKQFAKVDFDKATPWRHWNSADLDAIEALFPYGNNNAQDAPDDDDENFRVQNRQANPAAARLLFVLSQRSDAPFRGWRLRAFNNTYVPVVSADLIKSSFCSGFDTIIGHITTANYAAINHPHKRPTPHHNWSGDLPERKPTVGEVQHEIQQGGGSFPGNFAFFGMKEWSILDWSNKQNPYNFENKTTEDLGAIRIVSVHFRAQRLAGGAPPAYWATDGAHADRKYRLERDNPKGTSPVYKAAGTEYKGAIKPNKATGKGEGFVDEKKQKGPTEGLWKRRAVRVYFTFNHYRPVEFNVQSRLIQLSPWFAVEY